MDSLSGCGKLLSFVTSQKKKWKKDVFSIFTLQDTQTDYSRLISPFWYKAIQGSGEPQCKASSFCHAGHNLQVSCPLPHGTLWGLLSPSKVKHFHTPQFCGKKKKNPFCCAVGSPRQPYIALLFSGVFCPFPARHNSPYFLLAAMLDHDVHVDGPNVRPLGIAAEGALKEGLGMFCVPRMELQLCKPWNYIHIWKK